MERDGIVRGLMKLLSSSKANTSPNMTRNMIFGNTTTSRRKKELEVLGRLEEQCIIFKRDNVDPLKVTYSLQLPIKLNRIISHSDSLSELIWPKALVPANQYTPPTQLQPVVPEVTPQPTEEPPTSIQPFIPPPVVDNDKDEALKRVLLLVTNMGESIVRIMDDVDEIRTTVRELHKVWIPNG